MVIKIIILVLVHLSISAIAILMGKYLPNMVHKENEMKLLNTSKSILFTVQEHQIVTLQ